ncbi:MAG TPA: hypothetical protein VKT54_07255 [Steroidobacteraceae bacterium]|nr:hypothetical protein [Steroidobacteraceae bacterium]
MRASGSQSVATAFLAVLAGLSSACTTMRPITADTSGEQIRRELKPGDTVHVLTKSYASHSFEVTAIGATSLTGKAVRLVGVSGSDAWGTQIDVPYADIAQIEVRRLETWKTVAVVVVAVLAVDVAAASRSGSHHCCISQ